ncbi:MAG TPA: AmmeMemoRadiSam system protein B [Blastocatellia bacterium]|nr:AmmeMemoRadiSam system protein B [Blastocatellia bacterium]
MARAIVFAGIAPHPPLLVPEIGGNRIDQVASSQRALREFSRRLVNSKPETIVVISPHSPLEPQMFTARAATKLKGDFRDFRSPDVSLSFPNDLDLIDAIHRAARVEGIAFRSLNLDYPLDHGALVPLYYLHEAGWRGQIVVIGFTLQSIEHHLAFGRAIAHAAEAVQRSVAIVASGDLSHRLIVGGPYEYEPSAHLFDEQIVDAINRGDPAGVIGIEPALRERAGECGYRSILIALGTVNENLSEHQVLSYEGPFGVGYMVAVLTDKHQELMAEQ